MCSAKKKQFWLQLLTWSRQAGSVFPRRPGFHGTCQSLAPGAACCSAGFRSRGAAARSPRARLRAPLPAWPPPSQGSGVPCHASGVRRSASSPGPVSEWAIQGVTCLGLTGTLKVEGLIF